ncbi:LysR family transcriptional regulator [Roseibacterium beibuensis]|uniref:LysR family transcriptional regulator n=1 Tax=[Roseibacterium] beibuensis TaxID=1193142 RepID=A0ABP9LLA3_9RHOB|nr:LysR family transcriptional regulator [Roseibacterium beibuensis]MCS6626863.1 LysR family transcriptional regulator [Roseibacterium beibuensis]
MNRERLPWDDLKLLLAADRAGSLNALADLLAMDPTTASRRMKALEKSVGLSLFVRAHGALRLTGEGLQLLDHARAMEDAERAFRISVEALKDTPGGVVRISAPPTIARFVIAPGIGALQATAPNIAIEMDTEPANVRLENWETDIAVRLGAPQNVTDMLLVRRVGVAPYAVFEPRQARPELGWVTYSKRFSHVPEAAYVEEALAGAEPVLRSNDPMAMALAVAAGAGRAVLPVELGKSVAGIVQSGAPVLKREIWVLRHPETGETSAVRTAYEWLVGLFDAHS